MTRTKRVVKRKRVIKAPEVMQSPNVEIDETEAVKIPQSPVLTAKQIKARQSTAVVIKPLDDGGATRIKLDLADIDVSKSRWMINGNWFPILVQNMENKERAILPFVKPDEYGTTASSMYDANNPNALHNCWRKKHTMLQKLAIGVLAALAIALFFILFLMMKGGS